MMPVERPQMIACWFLAASSATLAKEALQLGGLFLGIEGDDRAGPEGGSLFVAARARNAFYLLPKPRVVGCLAAHRALVHESGFRLRRRAGDADHDGALHGAVALLHPVERGAPRAAGPCSLCGSVREVAVYDDGAQRCRRAGA
jgi:hypothetical protein